MSTLYIDSGNTRIKWGVRDTDGWLQKGSDSDLQTLSLAWRELDIASAFGCNVAGESARDAIESLRPDLGFFWIASQPNQCGVVNGYQNPSRLGADRWAALIGARPLLPQGGLVADLGTAATVDLLYPDGKFDGGIIVPGLAALRDAIFGKTGLDAGDGCFSYAPRNTADAIQSGAILALCGAIEKLSRQSGLHRCILTGGNAKDVLECLDLEAEIVEDLVLEGLVLISGESA